MHLGHRVSSLTILVFSLLLSGAAFSNEDTPVDVRKEFSGQRAQILQNLGDGQTYSEIAPSDRAAVVEALARIEATLAEATPVEGLPEAKRIQLHNDQEQINTILTRARADSRLICEKRVQTGSHRRTTACTTVAQREQQRNEAGDELKSRLYRTPGRRIGE